MRLDNWKLLPAGTAAPRARTLTKQIVIRIDDDLNQRLQQDAETNGRTVAQSVRFHLTAALLAPSEPLHG